MTHFRIAGLPAACLCAGLLFSNLAGATTLKICQIKAAKGQRFMSQESVQKFVTRLAPAIVAERDSAERYPFEFEDATGCMVANVPAGWNQLHIVYTFDDWQTSAEFPPLVGKAFKIVEEPIRQKGDVLWINGGIQAKGEPVAAMLYLLTQETSTLKDRAQRALNQGPMSSAVYLDLQAYAADLKANLDLELADAADKEQLLASNAEKAKAVEGLLNELSAKDDTLRERYSAAKAATTKAKSTLTEFQSLVDRAKTATQDIATVTAAISQKYSAAEAKEVSQRVTDLIKTISVKP